MNRRTFLAVAAVTAGLNPAARSAPAVRGKFGFSLYGMKTLPVADALKACAEIGYDGVELALMPGYPTEPKLLDAAARTALRKQLADRGLALHGLMENLPEPAADPKATLDRLKAAFELANALAPDAAPPVETILGNKPAAWPDVKAKLVERLGAWANAAAAARVVVAVKPHVGNALHTPDDAAWLVKQVNSPWLRLAFDQSHFAVQSLPLAGALAALLPATAFVHVKDAKGTPAKFEFLLPGDGTTIDYPDYFGRLAKAKYAGPVVVEVSGQISNKPGYDPVAAAKTSYANLAPAMKAAGFRS